MVQEYFRRIGHANSKVADASVYIFRQGNKVLGVGATPEDAESDAEQRARKARRR